MNKLITFKERDFGKVLRLVLPKYDRVHSFFKVPKHGFFECSNKFCTTRFLVPIACMLIYLQGVAYLHVMILGSHMGSDRQLETLTSLACYCAFGRLHAKMSNKVKRIKVDMPFLSFTSEIVVDSRVEEVSIIISTVISSVKFKLTLKGPNPFFLSFFWGGYNLR